VNRSPKAVLIWSAIILLAIPLLWRGWSQAEIRSTAGTQLASAERVAAPDLAFKVLDGDRARLSDYRGQVIVLNFWATWCPPCRQEVPDFVDLYRSYQDQEVAFIGVAFERGGLDPLRAFSKQKGIPYVVATLEDVAQVQEAWAALEGIPTVFGPGSGGPEASDGSVQYLPTTFVIDKSGRIYRKHVGPRTRGQLEPEVKTLLAEGEEDQKS
jgi:cytochrome c biogenesis protein CcmG/thiol:disulfide interchange protein DsbE